MKRLSNLFSPRDEEKRRLGNQPLPLLLANEKQFNEILKHISKDSPLDKRISYLEELCDYVSHYKVTDLGKLWNIVKDLVDVKNVQIVCLKLIYILSDKHSLENYSSLRTGLFFYSIL